MNCELYIPRTLQERTALRQQIAYFVTERGITPPVALHSLHALADEVIAMHGIDAACHDWVMVEVHNAVWKDIVASIPHDRRLLLLPKCLSRSGKCEGEIDELGLLCHRCGRCHIPSLQERADELGALSMVAEGFTSVIELIENEVVDAVIGVSCLDSLEKAFPLLSGHAVPGLAIALNHDGCHDTDVDVDYLLSLLAQRNAEDLHLLNYSRLHEEVKGWFGADTLRELIADTDETSQIALDALSLDGKRWRPFLLASVYQAVSGQETLSDEVRRAAVAVECFHKASLVHDDIQDGDTERYGRPTVHARYGEAIAINVGDLLLGWGYRLLASCSHRELVSTIASAHINLCKGQGTELAWTASYRLDGGQPPALTLDFVLDIFAHKTVPAFEMALLLGLICADHKEDAVALSAYSRNLGIAYQLNDDVEDVLLDNGQQTTDNGQKTTDNRQRTTDNGQQTTVYRNAGIPLQKPGNRQQSTDNGQQTTVYRNAGIPFQKPDNGQKQRPSAILALLSEHSDWTQDEAIEEVRRLSEQYRQQALDAIEPIACLELKRLLFQVTEKILKK